MSPYDPDSDPTYHVPGTTATPLSPGRLQPPSQHGIVGVRSSDEYEDSPPYGYSGHRPPPISVEKDAKHMSYDLVNTADFQNDEYTDPYARHDLDNDTIPLVNVRHRSRGESNKSKRYSTALPSTPLPHSPIPPGLAGGTGWLDRFEPAPVLPLLVHAILCLAAFPIMFYLTTEANGLSMFWTRVIVGCICGAVGLTLGVSLLDLSRRGIEAALWATIIHESMDGPAGGVTLSQLDYHTANPDSPWAAILLLYRRIFKHRGTGRSKRRNYDPVPWSACIVLFLITVTISACLVFVFGRVVDIYTVQQTQSNIFSEISVIGDLSPDDIQRADAMSAEFSNYAFAWSLSPFSASAHLPKDRSFSIPRPSGSGKNDSVHFAETYTRQLVPGGTGFGTFFPNLTAVWANATTIGRSPETVASGQTIRWPRWGERTVCQTIEETGNSITIAPASNEENNTYMYVTKAAVQGLLKNAEINPDLSTLPAADLSQGGYPLPTGVVEADIALIGKWEDDGAAHQFMSYSFDQGSSGAGWSMIQLVLVRLNESYAPKGQFHTYSDTTNGTRIGYDGAICVQEIRPYMLDSYNNTAGLPVTLGYLYSGANFNTTGKKMEGDSREGIQRGINSTGKWAAFFNAHNNSRNVLAKDNGRYFRYVPNPTVVSFTGGTEPSGYTKLNSWELQDVLGDVDSQHLLPYLVGSQEIVAHTYPDKTVAHAKVYLVWLIVSLVVVLLLGFAVAIFVPRLPLGLPRRSFGVISWLAAIEGDELVNLPMGSVGRHERLEDLQRKAKNVPVRYAAPGE
ncbi:hypothetical protein BDV93DRAFT_519523 [Ceratobasidium sp. AG-I]|nr:hypothetical protein BDV93DRAFT_519523 [Ceratobasidium sp. AG-I]